MLALHMLFGSLLAEFNKRYGGLITAPMLTMGCIIHESRGGIFSIHDLEAPIPRGGRCWALVPVGSLSAEAMQRLCLSLLWHSNSTLVIVHQDMHDPALALARPTPASRRAALKRASEPVELRAPEGEVATLEDLEALEVTEALREALGALREAVERPALGADWVAERLVAYLGAVQAQVMMRRQGLYISLSDQICVSGHFKLSLLDRIDLSGSFFDVSTGLKDRYSSDLSDVSIYAKDRDARDRRCLVRGGLLKINKTNELKKKTRIVSKGLVLTDLSMNEYQPDSSDHSSRFTNIAISSDINSTINSTINGTLNSAINSTINGTINSAINSTINGTINSAINSTINSTINGTLNRAGFVNRPINRVLLKRSSLNQSNHAPSNR